MKLENGADAADYSVLLEEMTDGEFVQEVAQHFTPEQSLILIALLIRVKAKKTTGANE